MSFGGDAEIIRELAARRRRLPSEEYGPGMSTPMHVLA